MMPTRRNPGRDSPSVIDRAGRPAGLEWTRDRATWPNTAASRFVEAGGIRWHVQVMGQGPLLLLVHGTGASTHSWRDLAPLLAEQFTVVAPDLPGHAFTSTPAARGMALPGMAGALADLLQVLGLGSPRVAVGHSAGAAILVRMCLDGAIAPAGLVSLNGALLPIGGVAGRVFSPLARLLASNPVVPRLFAWWADDDAVVERFIGQTGSTLDGAGLALYGRLISDPRHAAGALAMMANWDLDPIERQLPRLKIPLVLISGDRDATISPEVAFRVRDRVAHAKVHNLRGLGHLAHEERPDLVAALIERYAREWSLLPPAS